MTAPEPLCLFLSRADAERFRPAAGGHLVSISDGPEDLAVIDETEWESVSYHHFIDAGFDEETIALYGTNFERTFRDYLLMPKADALRDRLNALAQQRAFVVINCQAGRSRSAAAAAYLRDRHGYRLEKPTPDANMCVVRMLSRDASMMAAYREATRQTEPAQAPGGFLSAIKSMLSRL